MLSRAINVALVDDHTLFRKTLKNFLDDQKDINVAVQASDIFDLFNQLKGLSIDLLLMDIFLPELNGNDALEAVKSQYPGIKVVVLSMCTDTNMISDLLQAGIYAYISKGDEPEELLQAIWTAADNRLYRNRLFTEALYLSRQKDILSIPDRKIASINERERRILQLIWEEKSNKEIADELFLGVRSVEKIRQDLKEKIGVKSTVGMLKYAIEKKIIYTSLRLFKHT